MNSSKMPTTSSRSLGSSVMVQAVRTIAMVSPKRWWSRDCEGPSAALPDLWPATAEARQIAVIGLRLAPQKLHDAPADLPSRRGAPQLVVVARHEDDRRLGVLLEDLVGRQVGERLCMIAVDRHVVDVEEVVLPDDRRGRFRDPGRQLVAALDRIAVAVMGPDVVRQDAANAFGIERVNR